MKDTETTKKVELVNDGRITNGVLLGLAVFILSQSILFVFLNMGAKSKCLSEGGIFTQGMSIAAITFTTCTYSK